MKVLIKSLLCLALSFQTLAIAQSAVNGISKISGIDIIAVEESLQSIRYDADLQELNLVSDHASLTLENWHEDWLVAFAGLLEGDTPQNLLIDTIDNGLEIDPIANIMLKSQGQFRMSGPFETIELYAGNTSTNTDAGADSTALTQDSFIVFVGNDIPLKWSWLAEFENKISTSGVTGGRLELLYKEQTYQLTQNVITKLEDNLCVNLMALNESQTSDIMGNQTSEWRFDVALYKCSENVIF